MPVSQIGKDNGVLSAIVAFLKDESGTATMEYCAAGGVLSGMIFWAFQVLRDTQTAALERALENLG